MSNKHQLIKEVIDLVKTNPYPYNETNIEDWINEGDTDGMTPQEIANEWDELNQAN